MWFPSSSMSIIDNRALSAHSSILTLRRSPYGEIPWPRLSRLSDEEMKALMIDIVNKTYRTLTVLFDNRLGSELIKVLAQRDLLPQWNEPTLS